MKATVNIKNEAIQALFVGAFEGGSNYWVESVKEGSKPKTDKIRNWSHTDIWYYNWQFEKDGSIIVVIDEPIDHSDKVEYTVDRECILKGMDVFAEKYPRHFANVMKENDDAETADVFLQCCLFGELVYG